MIRAGSKLRGPQLYTKADIAALSGAAFHARSILDELIQNTRPGVSPLELEAICRSRIEAVGGHPAMADIEGFGYACSICINDTVAHARPNTEPLGEGQLVTIDLMLARDGWHADVADTFVVGGGGHPLLDALDAVWQAGLDAIKPDVAWAQVAAAMADAARSHDASLVRGLAGHGIGLAPHELPVLPLVPGAADPPVILRPGMAFTLEPAITNGNGEIRGQGGDSEDGWAIRTSDGAPAAAREAMIAVNSDGFRALGGPVSDDS